MSYPYDFPAVSMDNIWNSGSYTPEDVVVYIRDNYTPVNKTSMRNSVGYQLSLVQNFVNEHYLGRSDLAIHSGYINYLYSSGIESSSVEVSDSTNSITIVPNGATFEGAGATSSIVNDTKFIVSSSDELTQLTHTGIYIEKTVGAITGDSTLGVSGLYFTYPNGDPCSIVASSDGELQLNSTVHFDIATPKITLTNESSRLERLYNTQQTVTWSETSPTSIDTGIGHLKNVSLVYFAVHGDGTKAQVYQDNWIPANYSPYPSGFPLMTNSTTLNTFRPHDVPSPAYSGEYWKLQYGAHLLQKGAPIDSWYIVISPVSDVLYAFYGSSVQCRYTLAVFN